MNQKKNEEVSLGELQQMCNDTPQNVSIAKKSALDRAASDFGILTGAEIKQFIVDGLEKLEICPPTMSNRFPNTPITGYRFMTGKKHGYLAFHRSAGGTNGIHIKSFHSDDTNPSLGTLGSLFQNVLSGEKK